MDDDSKSDCILDIIIIYSKNDIIVCKTDMINEDIVNLMKEKIQKKIKFK